MLDACLMLLRVSDNFRGDPSQLSESTLRTFRRALNPVGPSFGDSSIKIRIQRNGSLLKGKSIDSQLLRIDPMNTHKAAAVLPTDTQ